MEYNAAMTKVFDKVPPRMRRLPITEEGWPQLWFAGITEAGKPDLRCANPAKRVQAVTHDLCWLCGQTLGVWKVFVTGPMCAVNRTTSEPPCHLECAQFAVLACPFLSRPKMKRNDADLPDGYEAPPGYAIMRNPGATALWVCKSYRPFRVDSTEWLIEMGEPREVLWYAEGGFATRAQVRASIDSGYPALLKIAKEQSGEAVVSLARKLEGVKRFLPAA
jgi:hypothetical protein